MKYFPSSSETKTLGTEDLRAAFLLTDLFKPDKIVLHITDLDRAVVGGAMPVKGIARAFNAGCAASKVFW
jgi:4-deoxy-L-threo-5-hexosulose-uronate ketol-isomerase